MLNSIDLNQKLSKSEYQECMSELKIRMGVLQRQARMKNVPVAILFEGWDAAGKGTMINTLLRSLDARGYKVHPINPPNEEEQYRPYLWRFWMRTPARGIFAIYDRSWYGRVLVGRVDKLVKKSVWQQAFEDINTFEKHLSDDGAIIIKFFLHISQKEQKKRFTKLLKNPSTSWKVTQADWQHHKQYNQYTEAIEEMVNKTSHAHSKWTIVESHDRRHATVKVFQTCIDTLESGLSESDLSVKKLSRPSKKQKSKSSILDKIDLSQSLDRDTYEKRLKNYQKQVHDLEHEVYLQRIPVVIAYEGWDAGGKGGNIRRLVQGMDPRGFEVVPVGAPNDIENAHHYLWRFWAHFPKAGHIVIFDRSWYGRVLVERVEGFCSETEWQRAYDEINEMEAQWARYGAVIFKFWLHIDADEQLRRFESRKQIEHKQWKITDEDWRNRDKWNDYKHAVDDMLLRTGTDHAPWTVVEANDKLHARIKVLKTVVKTLKKTIY